MRYGYKWALRLLGLILFIMIYSNLDSAKIAVYLSNININYFIIANALLIPLVIIKSIRWQQILNAIYINYRLKELIIIYAASIFIGYLTPGNLGDFSKALYLKQNGNPLGKSFASVLLDRLFDVISIFLLGSFGLVFLIGYSKMISLSILIILLVFFLIFVIYIFKISDYKSVIRSWLPRFFTDLYMAKMVKEIRDFNYSFFIIDAKHFSVAVILTLIGWIIYFISIYFLALSINLEVPFLYLAICISISIIITLIPVTIAGIGTRDATLITLFSYLGYRSESAVALSMTLLAYYLVNILICLVAWLIKPLDLSNAKNGV